MILAKCKDCGNLFYAAVMGEVGCPKCGSKNTCVAIYKEKITEGENIL